MSDTTSNPVAAAMWMSGVVVSFTVMAVAGREASVELDPSELLMYRSIIGIAIIVAICLYSKTLAQIRVDRIGLHVIRNASHFLGQILWIFAIFTIPLAQVFAFEFSTPLWTAVLAPFFLGERMTWMRRITITAGFIGILIVARPGFSQVSPGVIAAILCAVGFAVSAIATRKLVGFASVICILFWMVVIQSILSFVIAGLDGDIAFPTARTAVPVLLVALTGLSAHYCLASALRCAPAVIVMPLDFARLPIIAVVGMLLYDETLDLFIFLGAAIIVCANYLNIRNEANLLRRAK